MGMEGVNDRMREELENLLVNLETHLEKAKDNKKRYLESKMHTDGLYEDDDGTFCVNDWFRITFSTV